MKYIVLLIVVCFSEFVLCQNHQIANNYYEKGDFEKAHLTYAQLLEKNPTNSLYFDRLVDCNQQLMQYDEAITMLQERVKKRRQVHYLVDLGYVYQLQDKQKKADKYYSDAILEIEKRPGLAYNIGKAFEKKILLDWALKSYETALLKNPNSNYNYSMALLYGQKGNTGKMIELLLDEAKNNPRYKNNIQAYLSRFMAGDVEGTFKNELRKALLVRAQKDQNIFWNQFLSWFFVQNKQFVKAFRQQKAVVRRSPTQFSGIVDLVHLAIDEDDRAATEEIATFILEQTISDNLRLSLQYKLLSNELEIIIEDDFDDFEKKLNEILFQYGSLKESYEIKILTAHFEAFYKKEPELAIKRLLKLLDGNLSIIEKAKVKMELADVLVLQEQFNRALIYYSQVEMDLKNNPLGHQARFKVAKTSYYKGDFEWALKQVRVLKASESQLIANDALDLFLLITDNNQIDTTYAALKSFAYADFKKYQRKEEESIQSFKKIGLDFPKDIINEPANIRLGELYTQIGEKQKAIVCYEYIIVNAPQSVYVDEAYYYAGLLCLELNQMTKAKEYFEKVIVDHVDSIYYNKSQFQYRTLRGDTNF